MSSVADNLASIRQRIEAACLGCGRDPSEVTLLAVSKRQESSLVQEAIDAGQTDFAENQVQALCARVAEFGSEKLRWHMVGALQSNKGKQVTVASCLHGITSQKAAKAVSKAMVDQGHTAPMPIFLQVNISQEASKSGFAADQVKGVIQELAELPLLDLRGLMCIPERGHGRAGFAALRHLQAQLQDATGQSLKELSMGMSGDYEEAIREGATTVRVGRAIFGERSDLVNA